MGSEPIVTTLSSRAVPDRPLTGSSLIACYWAVTKPEVNFLVLITTFAGFALGSASEAQHISLPRLFNALLGTLLVAGGTAALNQYLERSFDAQMRRTARRPVAAGRIEPNSALIFGTALAVSGSIYLDLTSSPLASLLALLTLLSYLFLYTPLKRRTPLCVFVGTFPGAMPPIIGWAAVSSHLNMEAWLLYATLLLWQFPHFMAIAWMYREDYERAGYHMLPKGNATFAFVILQTILPLLALIPIGIVQGPARHAAIFECTGLVLGLGYLYFGLEFVFRRSRLAARRLLAASIIYLPALCVLKAVLR